MTEPLIEIQRRSMSGASRATADAWSPEDALDAEEIEELLRVRRYAVMSTTRPDGRPHGVPVAFLHRDGRFWLAAGPGTVRRRNLAAQPQASLVVMGPQDDDDHIALVVEGLVREAPGAKPALVDAWETRFDDRLEWADLIYELEPTKVLSHGHRSPVG